MQKVEIKSLVFSLKRREHEFEVIKETSCFLFEEVEHKIPEVLGRSWKEGLE